MNQDIIQGKWTQLKGSLKSKWGKLTDDDLARDDARSSTSTASAKRCARLSAPRRQPRVLGRQIAGTLRLAEGQGRARNPRVRTVGQSVEGGLTDTHDTAAGMALG